jgi:uncharacterized protein (DUF2384 family)
MVSGVRLRATDAKNFPKLVKTALRTRDKIAQSQEELLKWIKHLNKGLHGKVPMTILCQQLGKEMAAKLLT